MQIHSVGIDLGKGLACRQRNAEHTKGARRRSLTLSAECRESWMRHDADESSGWRTKSEAVLRKI
jgi:hypothetical protein